MNRAPIVLIALAGLLLLFLIASVSFIRTREAEAEQPGPAGGLGGNTIPQTGQEAESTPGAEETPGADGAPTPGSGGTLEDEGTPAANETPQVTSEAGMGQETAEVTPTQPRPASTLRPSSTPIATNTPIPTFTRVPTGTPTTATTPTTNAAETGQAYRQAAADQMDSCNTALETFEQFGTSLTQNITLVLDPQTRGNLDANLAEINQTCGQLGSAEPVPPEMAQADRTLDRAADEFHQMTATMTNAVNNLDPGLFAQALTHLQNGVNLANQAETEMP